MPPQHAHTSRHEERVMWQVEAPQTDIGPAWNVLFSTPIESSVENAFGDGKLTPPGLNQIQSNSLFCNIFPGNNDIGVQGSPAAQVQSPASLNSSCTTSLSESPTRTSWLPKDLQTQNRETMNNNSVTSAGSHVADDDPEGACPPIGAGGNWWTSLLLSNIQMQPSQSVTGSIPDLDTLNWSSDLPAAGSVGQFPTSMGLPPSTVTAHCNQQLGAGTTGMADSSLSVSGVSSDNALWGQVFLSGPGSNEAVQGLLNCSVEELPELLYARALRQGNDFAFPDQSKKLEESAPWDLPPKSFTFQGDEMNMAILEKPPATLQYPQLVDDRLSSTASTLPEMDQWSAARAEHHHTTSVNAFTPGLELPNSAQFDHGRVKQEYPSTSPFWLQGFGADPYKSDAISGQLMEHKPIFKPYAAAANLIASSMVDEYPGRWTPAIHSRFPSALQHGLPARHSPQMIAFSNCFPRLPLDVTSLRPELRQQVHGPASDRGSPLQYMQQHALEGKPLHDSSSNVRALQGRVEDGGETTSYQKRNASSVTKSCEHVSEGYFKRPRVEPSVPALPYKQVRKEKLGDRITTLQQLVSPFGKTDTASVLLEAIGYIKFLQEQVQTLSSPYMINASTTPSQNDPGKNSWSAEKSQDTDEPKLDLRSRGLCLVPVSCTVHVANDNGADFWTPTYGGNFR